MREIMRYIKYADDREMLDKVLNTEQRFKNLERSAAEIINAATNSKIKLEQGKETVDMCLAIQEMREESRIKGRDEGRNEGRIEGRIEGIRAFIQDKLEDGVAENVIISKLQRHFALDEETAQQYYTTFVK
jgi:predicted transposase YdaD